MPELRADGNCRKGVRLPSLASGECSGYGQVHQVRAAPLADVAKVGSRSRRGRHHPDPAESGRRASFRPMEQRPLLEDSTHLLRPVPGSNLRGTDRGPTLAALRQRLTTEQSLQPSQCHRRPVRGRRGKPGVRTCEAQLRPCHALLRSPQGSRWATWCCWPVAGVHDRLPGRTS